jgi:hypothetical protein
LKGEPFASDAGWAHAHWKSPWYATIADFRFLASPVDISEFRDFVKVSRTGAITRLSGDQAAALAELVRLRNPRVRL